MSEPISNPKQYPKWITAIDGIRKIVQDHLAHSRETGIEHDRDGVPVPKNVPPTLETVLAAGYSDIAAAAIVAEEQRKCAAGEKPYGDKEPTPPPVAPATANAEAAASVDVPVDITALGNAAESPASQLAAKARKRKQAEPQPDAAPEQQQSMEPDPTPVP